MIDFIGLGAQKSGTSWVYACLYEHPEICAPIKEIHFFSRDRYKKGKGWYESHFKKCVAGKLKGEFSTSYLYSKEAPGRIKESYPEAKLIVILRNPIERAYSQYRNAVKAGEIDESVTFQEYADQEPSVFEQGLYMEQLRRYLNLFDREQVLILIYEDSKKDQTTFVKTIYSFLGVNVLYAPSMLYEEINVARTPKQIWVDSLMHSVSEGMRRSGFDKFVHLVRKSGLPDFVRSMNTKPTEKKEKPNLYTDKARSFFFEDIEELSQFMKRNLVKEWNLGYREIHE